MGVDVEAVLKMVVGMKQDAAMDKLMAADLKWKLVSMNRRPVPCSDAGTRTDRVLLEMDEETVTGARIG